MKFLKWFSIKRLVIMFFIIAAGLGIYNSKTIATYSTGIYKTDGGDRYVITENGTMNYESGGVADFESGSSLQYNSTEIQLESLSALDTTELDAIDGLTASTDELNLLDSAVAGTVVEGKAVVADSTKTLDTVNVTDIGLTGVTRVETIYNTTYLLGDTTLSTVAVADLGANAFISISYQYSSAGNIWLDSQTDSNFVLKSETTSSGFPVRCQITH